MRRHFWAILLLSCLAVLAAVAWWFDPRPRGGLSHIRLGEVTWQANAGSYSIPCEIEVSPPITEFRGLGGLLHRGAEWINRETIPVGIGPWTMPVPGETPAKVNLMFRGAADRRYELVLQIRYIDPQGEERRERLVKEIVTPPMNSPQP